MFSFSKTYILNGRPAAYRGESGLGYGFCYLDGDSESVFIPLDSADSVSIAKKVTSPVQPDVKV